jgi:hypothetical protein
MLSRPQLEQPAPPPTPMRSAETLVLRENEGCDTDARLALEDAICALYRSRFRPMFFDDDAATTVPLYKRAEKRAVADAS